MDRTRLGAWSMVGLVVAQAVATAAFVRPGEVAATGLLLNAAAGLSVFWLLRRPGRNRWPLVAWAAGFFGWHATGLATLAGLVTTGLDPVFLIAAHLELSILYQAVLTTLAGFVVHLLLPRPGRASG